MNLPLVKNRLTLTSTETMIEEVIITFQICLDSVLGMEKIELIKRVQLRLFLTLIGQMSPLSRREPKIIKGGTHILLSMISSNPTLMVTLTLDHLQSKKRSHKESRKRLQRAERRESWPLIYMEIISIVIISRDRISQSPHL